MAAKSVHLDFIAPGDYMHIDLASVESLELVRPLQPAPVGAANKLQGSLYGCEYEQHWCIHAAILWRGSVLEAAKLRHCLIRRLCSLQPLALLTLSASRTKRAGVLSLVGKDACSCRLLKRTRTLCGARLLKANILQPLTSVTAIRSALAAPHAALHCIKTCMEQIKRPVQRLGW